MSADVENRNWRNIYGFMPDWAIIQMIKEGIIGIDPLREGIWEENMGPVTIDFHLGRRVLIPQKQDDKVIKVKQGILLEDHKEKFLKPGEEIYIKAGAFIIAEVQERLRLPNDVIGFLDGKSSLARLGVVVHLTAGRFDPGWDNIPVLEFKNSSENGVEIPEGWPVCAFLYYRMMAEVDRPYGVRGRYVGAEGIQSLAHLEPENGGGK